jgi:hypothetical protein
MPEDLLMFMRARLDEDEEAAKAVGYARIQTGEYLWGSKYLLLQDGKGGESKATTEFDGDLAEHIARHDPARVLADVEAKRALLDLYVEHERMDRETFEAEGEHARSLVSLRAAYLDAVRCHATVYADHPDYREEWRP